MSRRAMEGTSLAAMVRMALPICRAAERQRPRPGPGRLPDYDDASIAMLIAIAVLKKRTSKSAQYRFLTQHRRSLMRWLNLKRWPTRSTYFRRYRRAHQLLNLAIEVQGRQALAEGIGHAQTVAVDKSLVSARGPKWHRADRKRGRVPRGLRGVDRDSDWGFSHHAGWVQGYSYEVLVTAGPGGVVLPLLASADTAAASEQRTFGAKIDRLPPATRVVLADSGYDSNEHGNRIEYEAPGRRTGRRFLCPPNPRNTGRRRSRRPRTPVAAGRRRDHRRRQQRIAHYESRSGQRQYARRGQTVEPFHEWFKDLFTLTDRVWHRGLDNNRTQLLAAIFGYQLLLRYNHRRGRHNGQIRWILDTM